MEVKLPETIRFFRKQRKLTQEQLAQALNVSLGVISKWELGLSTPDIGLIMELADFFETSVDVLLGYQNQSRSREEILRELKGYSHNRSLPVPFDTLESYLSKFPNDFDIVYNIAQLYFLRGILVQDQAMLNRALELLQRACGLLSQNTDENISYLSLQLDIANLYRTLKRDEDALALYKRNNPCGINDWQIGAILAVDETRSAEAIRYLSQALIQANYTQFDIALGYLNAYSRQKRYSEALEVIAWFLDCVRVCRLPGSVNALDRFAAVFLACEATTHLRMDHLEQARQSLVKAWEAALYFDKAPSYSATRMRFVEVEAATVYDDWGDTALESVERYIRSEENPVLSALWQEVSHAS